MNQSMVRGAIGGAALGASISGTLAWLFVAVLLGLEPIVFLACGIYAGTIYGSIVGALLGARDVREAAARAPAQRPVFGLAMVVASGRSR